MFFFFFLQFASVSGDKVLASAEFSLSTNELELEEKKEKEWGNKQRGGRRDFLLPVAAFGRIKQTQFK